MLSFYYVVEGMQHSRVPMRILTNSTANRPESSRK